MDAFCGEFLLHPAPLEYSGNTCSHNCAYCFSNIARPFRIAPYNETVNLIKDAKNRKTYTAALFNEGYSICISNKTDPFSKTNFRQTLSLLKLLRQFPNGIFFQTKFGEGFDEARDILKEKKNVVWYVTITCADDDMSKQVEPGAPPTSERIKIAKQLASEGELVIIAFNPYVSQWMPKTKCLEMAEDFIRAGIKHFVFQALYLREKDVKNFKDDRKNSFGDIQWENYYRTPKSNKVGQLEMQETLNELYRDGRSFPVAFGMPYPTKFFHDVRNRLGKCFPSNYDFINFIEENPKEKYTLNDFIKVVSKDNEGFFKEKFKTGIPAYVLRVARQVWRGNKEVQNANCINDVLKIYWNEKRISGSIQNFYHLECCGVDDSGNVLITKKRKEV